MEIRHAEPADHARVAGVIDDWWGGRRMRDMLPRLFFTHFRDTSFVADDGAGLAGFLCGFLSQNYPDQPYVHFVGVAPERRKSGLASELYERFFEAARSARRTSVHCVTSPGNTGSLAFHRRIGFEIEAEVEGYDGSGEIRVLLRRAL
ncbi:MAG TPA: GNAT family N-acetyltransferase [Gaiellaceae bacterium]|nr:GNAT family N-acetyltransferase [Gaiellaceae bacterium]